MLFGSVWEGEGRGRVVLVGEGELGIHDIFFFVLPLEKPTQWTLWCLGLGLLWLLAKNGKLGSDAPVWPPSMYNRTCWNLLQCRQGFHTMECQFTATFEPWLSSGWRLQEFKANVQLLSDFTSFHRDVVSVLQFSCSTPHVCCTQFHASLASSGLC